MAPPRPSLYPTRSAAGALLGQQLAARGYFVDVEHPELGRTFRYPGAPYVFGGTPWRLYRRPPLLGEHTAPILRDELGLNPDELAVLSSQGVI